MDFIEIAIILMLCVLSFVVGQKLSNPKSVPASKNDKYKKLPESYEEDEEVFHFFLPIFANFYQKIKECISSDGHSRDHAEKFERTTEGSGQASSGNRGFEKQRE